MPFGAQSGAQLGRILVCASALLGAGCKDEPSSLAAAHTSGPAGPKIAPDPSPDAPPQAPAPRPLPPRDPGPAPGPNSAYVNVPQLGVFVLDAAGWRLHYPTQDYIADMAVVGEELFVLSEAGVTRVDGQGQAKLVAPLEPSGERFMPWRMSAAGPNEFWILGDKIGHWQGSWAFEAIAPSWGTEPSGGTDIVLDHHGEPWLSWAQIYRHAGDQWTGLELTVGSPDQGPPELVAHPGAKLVVVKSRCDDDACELLRFRDSAPQVEGDPWEVRRVNLALHGCPEYAFLSVSDSGAFAALGGFCAVVRVPLDTLETEATHLRLTHADGTWPGQMPASLAVDDQGRIWTGTSEGLIVADGTGPAKQLPSARLGPFAGEMNKLIVRGDGPPLPELGAERRGALRARATNFASGEALANTAIELCSAFPGPEFGADTSASPCAGVERTWTATTDADGRFEVAELPVAHYFIVVEVEGAWRNTFPAVYEMRAGETTDLGDVSMMSR